MGYIVLDLEWNQPASPKFRVRDPFYLSGEIIQFGAVKLDDNFKVVDQYNKLVKPIHYRNVHKDITELTDITTEMLEAQQGFAEVYEDFCRWTEGFGWITWSTSDLYMMEENMELHGLDPDEIPPCYDVQLMFDDQITQDDRQFSLSYAMWKLEIKGELSHDALNDALNTVAVMKHLDLSELEDYEY